MELVEPVFRPPSEAQSLILQATVGCSHNACTFCAMYRNKRFRARPLAELEAEVAEAAASSPGVKRVFLGDGDALAAPAETLLGLLAALRRAFPALSRVSLYASPQNLLEKSEAELARLREAGLSLFYLGLESGDDAVLSAVNKGVTAAQAVEAVRRGHRAGLRSSVMVLLGLGGTEGSSRHALGSAAALNAMQPHHLSCLTWYPVPQAPLYHRAARGTFALPDDAGVLRELRELLAALRLEQTVFRANHASNPLPLSGRLDRDRAQLLDAVDAALDGQLPLVPAFLRGT